MQEIEAIMGGGWIFDTGPFFVRDYGTPQVEGGKMLRKATKVYVYVQCFSLFS